MVWAVVQGLILVANSFLPLFLIIVDFLMRVLALVWAALVVAFVDVDFWSAYHEIYTSLSAVGSVITGLVVWIFTAAPRLIQIFMGWVVVWGMIYMKEWYTRSRGMLSRYHQLREVRASVKNPLRAVYMFLKRIKDLIPFV